MGGQVFQDALKETAKVHGIAIDEMIKDEGSFRETLSKGWLTSDILTETLAKFTGDLNEDQLRTMGYTDDQIKSIMEMGKTANDAATKDFYSAVRYVERGCPVRMDTKLGNYRRRL